MCSLCRVNQININLKQINKMKIDWNLVLAIVIASIVVSILNRLVIDKVVEKIGNYEIDL